MNILLWYSLLCIIIFLFGYYYGRYDMSKIKNKLIEIIKIQYQELWDYSYKLAILLDTNKNKEEIIEEYDIDLILDQINEKGLNSLNENQLKFLIKNSKNLNN